MQYIPKSMTIWQNIARYSKYSKINFFLANYFSSTVNRRFDPGIRSTVDLVSHNHFKGGDYWATLKNKNCYQTNKQWLKYKIMCKEELLILVEDIF